MIQRARLGGSDLEFYPLNDLAKAGIEDPSGLPMTVKILLEGLVRLAEAGVTDESNIGVLAHWPALPPADAELPFLPARVLMQDFTGVPAVVDLAAMRSAMQRAGKDAGRVDPLVPVDLVIDHSVQVDSFGFRDSYTRNIEKEIERNRERYSLLRWAQQAFHNFSLVPPGMGICHQVNLEHLAKVVQVRDVGGKKVAIPDTLMGTDSHTTMVNGLGVLGWGTGGIEAEAAILGQPAYLAPPIVVGVRFLGALPAGSTATDLVLTLTEMLRKHGVVDKFVEFCGDGLSSLSVPDRATLSNMCPEYGATSALFPVDQQTLRYLQVTGRDREQIDLVERYAKEQGLFRVDGAATPKFSELLELDLSKVESSLAGPKRPQDRVPLRDAWSSFTTVFTPGPRPEPEAISRLSNGSRRSPCSRGRKSWQPIRRICVSSKRSRDSRNRNNIGRKKTARGPLTSPCRTVRWRESTVRCARAICIAGTRRLGICIEPSSWRRTIPRWRGPPNCSSKWKNSWPTFASSMRGWPCRRTIPDCWRTVLCSFCVAAISSSRRPRSTGCSR